MSDKKKKKSTKRSTKPKNDILTGEGSATVIEKMLLLLNELRNAGSFQEKIDLIARGIFTVGWRRVHIYAMDSRTGNLKSASTFGLTDKEIEQLRDHQLEPEEIKSLFGHEYDAYKIGRSYFLPVECNDPMVVKMQGISLKSKFDRKEFKTWDPEDILYFPIIGFGDKLIGVISVDDPVSGERPTEENLRGVELFLDYATTVLSESEYEDYFNKTRNLISRLFDLSHTMIFIIDESETIIDINDSVSRDLGYRPHELIGRPEHIVFSSDTAYREVKEKRNEGIFEGEALLSKKDGTELWGHMSSIPVFDGEGQIDGYISTVVDITESKQLHQYLIRAEKLAGIGVLASGIAHEINNPLYAMLGMAEEIMDMKGLPKKAGELAKGILKNTGDVAEIVKDLSAYTFSAQHESPSSIRINELIKRSIKIVERSMKTPGVVFDLDLGKLPEMQASTGEVTQLFTNLLTNALDALDGMGGMISVRSRLVGGLVECRIRDTGRGIPDDKLRRIFEPFFTSKEVGKGTGLGLYACYRIITKHHGSIYVESTSPEGTCFVITIPVPRND